MKQFHIDVIVGARPNFMKVAALYSVAHKYPSLNLRLIHTGQHYDRAMSDVFLSDLKLPQPSCSLEVGSGSHAKQTAQVMHRYEDWVIESDPDLCIVVGDVNSTIACALVAKKCGVPVAHVEAGLRSHDETMPEEINRILTDSISDLLFVTESSGIANLAREGRAQDQILFVGNVMIDTLLQLRDTASKLAYHDKLDFKEGEYAYLTLHRPSNVDSPEQLQAISQEIEWLAVQLPVIFPVHPRTLNSLKEMKLLSRLEKCSRLHMVEPVGYLESLSLTMYSRVVVTDSGGLQEETSALGIPCLTLRHNTERPVTVSLGTNILIKDDWKLFRETITRICSGEPLSDIAPIPLWDGKTSERILSHCCGYLKTRSA